jgi:hypothetical protein
VNWPTCVHTCVARETIAQDLKISYYVLCIENKMSYGKSRGSETLCDGEAASTNTALVHIKLRSNDRHEHMTPVVAKRTVTLTAVHFIASNQNVKKTFMHRVCAFVLTVFRVRQSVVQLSIKCVRKVVVHLGYGT